MPEGEPEKAIADRRLPGERPSESKGRESRQVMIAQDKEMAVPEGLHQSNRIKHLNWLT